MAEFLLLHLLLLLVLYLEIKGSIKMTQSQRSNIERDKLIKIVKNGH